MSNPVQDVPTLYGHRDSGHACQVLQALTLAHIEHRQVPIDIWQPREQRPEPFRSLAPFGEVPLRVLDGRSRHHTTRSGAKVARSHRQPARLAAALRATDGLTMESAT